MHAPDTAASPPSMGSKAPEAEPSQACWARASTLALVPAGHAATISGALAAQFAPVSSLSAQPSGPQSSTGAMERPSVHQNLLLELSFGFMVILLTILLAASGCLSHLVGLERGSFARKIGRWRTNRIV